MRPVSMAGASRSGVNSLAPPGTCGGRGGGATCLSADFDRIVHMWSNRTTETDFLPEFVSAGRSMTCRRGRLSRPARMLAGRTSRNRRRYLRPVPDTSPGWGIRTNPRASGCVTAPANRLGTAPYTPRAICPVPWNKSSSRRSRPTARGLRRRPGPGRPGSAAPRSPTSSGAARWASSTGRGTR